LADRPAGGRPSDDAIGYRQIVPLEELFGEILDKGRTSKAVTQLYDKAIASLGPEFDILLDIPTEAIAAAVSPRAAEAVKRMRAGQVSVRPGYDGVFGRVSIFNDRKPDQGRLDL
jgi:PHP family Zn ribbon phosphoesterase